MPTADNPWSYLDQIFEPFSTERSDRSSGNRNETKQTRERTVVEEIYNDGVKYRRVTTYKVKYKKSTSVVDDTQTKTTSTATSTKSMNNSPPTIPQPPTPASMTAPESTPAPTPAPSILIRRGSYDEVFKRNGRLYIAHHKSKHGDGKRA